MQHNQPRCSGEQRRQSQGHRGSVPCYGIQYLGTGKYRNRNSGTSILMRRHASPKFHQSNNEHDIDIGWFAWNHLTHLTGFAGIYMSDDGTTPPGSLTNENRTSKHPYLMHRQKQSPQSPHRQTRHIIYYVVRLPKPGEDTARLRSRKD